MSGLGFKFQVFRLVGSRRHVSKFHVSGASGRHGKALLRRDFKDNLELGVEVARALGCGACAPEPPKP